MICSILSRNILTVPCQSASDSRNSVIRAN